MKFGTVDISAILIGAIWGTVWMIITGIVLMLVSGLIVSPLVGLAALIGAVGGFVYLLANARFPSRTRAIGALALAALVLFVLLSLGQPFGTGLGQKTLYQLIALLIWSGLTALSVGMCLEGYQQGSAKRYRMELLLIRLLKGLAFVFFTIIVVLPFYVMLMTSFKSQQSLLANPLDFSINFAQGFDSLFRSYVELFTQYHFGSFLMNTALVSVCTVLITLAFAIPGGYAVARLRFPGQALLSRSILLIYMVPAIVLVIPLYAVFSQLGLRNSLTGLLIVYPATTIPVALYMLQGYFRGLPSELEEAGLMDGLSRLGVIAKITMPLSLPALASVALYVFMIAWNEFLYAFLFLAADTARWTLPLGLQRLDSQEVPVSALMAGSLIVSIPIIVIFFFFERFLTQGLTAGAVKG